MKKLKTISPILVIVIIVFTLFSNCGTAQQNANKSSNTASKLSQNNQNINTTISEAIENEQNIIQTPTTSAPPTTTSTPTPTKLAVEQQVLLDHDNIKITLNSIEEEDFWGPSLKLLIENNSDKEITVQARDISINNLMVDCVFSSNVQAGKKANDSLSFSSSDLKTSGITTIKDIQLKFLIIDPSSYDNRFQSDIINITTNADPSYVQSYDDSGVLVVDQDGIKIVAKNVDYNDNIFGPKIQFYLENNTDKDVTIQIRDSSINGFMISPTFSSDVAAGKKIFDSMSFLKSTLDENGIEEINNLEGYFTVIESSNFNTRFNTEPFNISFE